MTKFLLSLIVLTFATNTSALSLSGENYPKISTEKVAYITGQFDQYLEKNFAFQMKMTKHLPGDRVIIVNSPGGALESGLKIEKLIQAERAGGTRVVCVVTGHAASMAFNILAVCDVRLAVKSAMLLFHPVALQADCETRRCTGKILKQWAEQVAKDEDQFRKRNAKLLKMTLSEYDSFAEKDIWWTAEQLLRRGFLHSLVEVSI